MNSFLMMLHIVLSARYTFPRGIFHYLCIATLLVHASFVVPPNGMYRLGELVRRLHLLSLRRVGSLRNGCSLDPTWPYVYGWQMPRGKDCQENKDDRFQNHCNGINRKYGDPLLKSTLGRQRELSCDEPLFSGHT
ncbi:hypothetical protein F5Y18DRAFT_403213 [Xylariaceae sp. FL1019]|nr:hypothetical protein F5Y18DRAFT_403213 [Xylariaceae sp. FL1019]